jgi:hypothetical protein
VTGVGVLVTGVDVVTYLEAEEEAFVIDAFEGHIKAAGEADDGECLLLSFCLQK